MSEVTAATTTGTASSTLLSRSGTALFVAASGLLVWGTAFDGRSFGPIRFLLRATPHGDKVGHFVLYGAIVLAVGLLVRKRIAAVAASFAVLIVGIADEYRQLLVGGRNFDLDDILANAGGVCFGLLIALAITGRHARSWAADSDGSTYVREGVGVPGQGEAKARGRVGAGQSRRLARSQS